MASRRRRTAVRRASGSRSLVVCDIENECGAGEFTEDQAREVKREIEHRAHLPEGSHVVVGTSSGPGLMCAGKVWPSARRVWHRGRDGADRALIDVLETENVVERFTHVVIASGDAAFAAPARSLRQAGVSIEVIARKGSLAAALASEADLVQILPMPRMPRASS